MNFLEASKSATAFKDKVVCRVRDLYNPDRHLTFYGHIEGVHLTIPKWMTHDDLCASDWIVTN